MNGAERVLVIILSSALAIFLVLAIVAVVLVIKVLNYIKRIAAKAEQLADKAEAIGTIFKATAGPAAIGRLLTNIAETVFQKSKKASSKEDD